VSGLGAVESLTVREDGGGVTTACRPCNSCVVHGEGAHGGAHAFDTPEDGACTTPRLWWAAHQNPGPLTESLRLTTSCPVASGAKGSTIRVAMLVCLVRQPFTFQSLHR
jgi:hypothetical protein